MAYYGNQPTVGQNQSFKVLDDISSYTETFDGTSTAVVSAANNTLTFYDHRFVQGQRVTYTDGGGDEINGLTTATAYYVIRQDKDTIQLAINATNAANGTAIGLSLSGTSGTAHTLNIAFDGTNTKFKATYQTGYHVKLTRAAQLQIAINGVVQEPVDSTSPSNGFGIDSNNVIVFSAAPVSTDDFWGTFLASNLPSWEISDNKVDNFDGNSTATNFTLSKLPANNENVLVTINGVVQHPSDATTTRAYKLIGQEIVFTSAPLTGEAIQVRHIGFAGAAAGGVTGFYGRTGNVTLTSADDVTINNITGVAATFTGNVSIGGTLTYTDVTNIDAVGIITAQQGIHIGAGATAGAIDVTTGIATFSSVGIADSIYHIGDGDTSLKFGTDTLSVKTAGNERLLVQAAGIVKVGDTFDVPTIRRQVQNSNVLISGGNATNDGANLNMYGSAHSSQASNFEFRTGSTERLKILSGGGVGIGDSIYHLGDDNTQIRFPTADTVTFETAGTERLRIDSDGRVSIGNNPTVDANCQLHVEKASGEASVWIEGNTGGAGAYLLLRNNSTSSNPKTYIGGVDSGGQGTSQIEFHNLDNGTNEGAMSLHTRPASGSMTERLRILSGGGVGIGASLYHLGDTNTFLNFGTDTMTLKTGGSTRIYLDNNYPTWIRRDAAGISTTALLLNHATNASGNGVGIAFAPTQNYTSRYCSIEAVNQDGNNNMYMTFKTVDSSQNDHGIERLRILSTGQVGIGTAAPGSPLEVSGGTALDTATFNTHHANGVLINLQRSGTSKGFLGSGKNIADATGGVDDIGLRSNANLILTAGGGTERARISSTGMVGINTTVPTAYLSFNAQRSTQTMPPICFQTSYGAGLADAAISTTDDTGGTDIMMGSNVYMGQNGTFNRYYSSYGSAAVRCQYTGKTIFYNKSGNNAPVESMRIDGDGDVGIGTNNPGSNNERLIVSKNYAAASGSTTIGIHNLHHTGSSSASSGQLNFMFSNYNASHEWWGGRILCYSTDNYNQYTYLRFDTANAGNATGKMWIRHDGKVGIKSEAPRGAIDVWGDGSAYPTLRLGTEAYQVDGEDIRFGRTDIGASDIRYHSIHTKHDTSGSSNYIHFKIHDAGGSPFTSQKTTLKLDGLGRVAINNATPQGDNKLTVRSDDASQAGANEGTVTGALALFYGGSRTTISGSNYLDTGVIHIKGQITDADTNSSGTHETGKIAFSGRRRYGAQAWIVHETEWVYSTQQGGSHLKFYTAGLASNGGDESTPGVRLHINKEGKLRHGSGLVSQVYGGGFSISHSGTTKTVTISGLISGSVMFHYGTYSSAGAGQGGISLHISGYQTATHTYDVHVIRNWSNGGGTGITISGVTKNASNCTFTVQNNHGSYTAGSSWHVWGNDEVNVSVS